ncbi:MAG TPA: hypothetical protein VHW45_10635, partial [Candidatus Sulfotelmatobacter sp.]|nr:hypothetical protein [Candidatus Sulfotelmatobacter sp.]
MSCAIETIVSSPGVPVSGSGANTAARNSGTFLQYLGAQTAGTMPATDDQAGDSMPDATAIVNTTEPGNKASAPGESKPASKNNTSSMPGVLAALWVPVPLAAPAPNLDVISIPSGLSEPPAPEVNGAMRANSASSATTQLPPIGQTPSAMNCTISAVTEPSATFSLNVSVLNASRKLEDGPGESTEPQSNPLAGTGTVEVEPVGNAFDVASSHLLTPASSPASSQAQAVLQRSAPELSTSSVSAQAAPERNSSLNFGSNPESMIELNSPLIPPSFSFESLFESANSTASALPSLHVPPEEPKQGVLDTSPDNPDAGISRQSSSSATALAPHASAAIPSALAISQLADQSPS